MILTEPELPTGQNLPFVGQAFEPADHLLSAGTNAYPTGPRDSRKSCGFSSPPSFTDARPAPMIPFIPQCFAASAPRAAVATAARQTVFGLAAIAAWMTLLSVARGQITPLPPTLDYGPPAWQVAMETPPVAPPTPVLPEPADTSIWTPPPATGSPRIPQCDCADEVWHSQVLPQGLIYQSYMAGMKEPRLSSFWSSDPEFGTLWDTALGGRVGLWRYGNDNPDWPEGWQVDMEGAVFPRLDPLGESTPLISSDYRFGVPVTYGRGKWQFKLAYYHISSHLGDEYILYLDPDRGAGRLNFVRDGIAFGTGYFWTPAFRLYGEIGYSPSATGGAEPLEFQFGFDWMQARNTGLRGGPFVATNANLREEVDFGGNFVVQFGWMWRQYVRGPNFRIGGQYFYGKSDQFEFFKQTESRIGWGIWYDF